MVGLVRQEERAASRELALRRAGRRARRRRRPRAGQRGGHLGRPRPRRSRPVDVRLVLLAATAPSSPPPPATTANGRSRRARGAWLREPRRPAAVPLASAARRRPQPSFASTRAESSSSFPSRSATRRAGCSSSARRSPLSRELVDSLESLASQVSLAVEGASLAEDLHRRQSEARFRSLVAHSSDLITVLDAHGTVTYQSPSVERVLGYRVDEIEGTRLRAAARRVRPARGWRRSSPASARPTSAAAPRPT